MIQTKGEKGTAKGSVRGRDYVQYEIQRMKFTKLLLVNVKLKTIVVRIVPADEIKLFLRVSH